MGGDFEGYFNVRDFYFESDAWKPYFEHVNSVECDTETNCDICEETKEWTTLLETPYVVVTKDSNRYDTEEQRKLRNCLGEGVYIKVDGPDGMLGLIEGIKYDNNNQLTTPVSIHMSKQGDLIQYDYDYDS